MAIECAAKLFGAYSPVRPDCPRHCAHSRNCGCLRVPNFGRRHGSDFRGAFARSPLVARFALWVMQGFQEVGVLVGGVVICVGTALSVPFSYGI